MSNLVYRQYLFEEFCKISKNDFGKNKRILEIGPKDGEDTVRLSKLNPQIIVLIDLPSKRELNNQWLTTIKCNKSYVESNFLYMSKKQMEEMGKFDLVWCTGVLYHNPEQLKFLRKIYTLLNPKGYLVLETAVLRTNDEHMKNGCFVEVFYPVGYRKIKSITHMPSIGAVKAWLSMVGFKNVIDSTCYNEKNSNLVGQRYACVCQKINEDDGDDYYNDERDKGCKFGEST